MTKTEYTAAIATTQAAISALSTDLRKLRAIEKLSQSFPDLKLVDASILETSITEKKAEVQKLRADLSKARRIVKRMAEIEDIEAGKTATPKAKKSAAKKDSTTTEKKASAKTTAKKPAAKPTAKKAEQSASGAETKENPAA